MKISLFATLLASLMVAFVSASAGNEILKNADIKGLKKDIEDELKRDLDNCEKNERNKDDFVDCVKDQVNDYDSDEIKSKDKRAIKKAAKDYDFKKARNPKNLR